MSSAAESLLSLRAISKRFGPVAALSNMQLEVKPGRVHALLGENGAGKSTLMKILSGVHAPDSGQMYLHGVPYAPKNPRDALNQGISIVFQELSLYHHLSVADNIFAAHEPSRWGFIRQRQLQAKASTLLAGLGLPVDASIRVGQLSMARRQLVEIAKALHHRARILILDEPTSSLSDAEAELLFAIIEKLKAQGTAIIYISHRMEEITRLADDISVIRDGEYVASFSRGEASMDELIALMVGRKMEALYPPSLPPMFPPANLPLLQVEGLACQGQFADISFSLRRGEILGFFGLIGSGRSDVMNALFGMRQHTGSIQLHGKRLRLSAPPDAIAAGIGFVTENRKEEGLVLGASVCANISMASLPDFSGGSGLIRFKDEQQAARNAIRQLGIRSHDTHTRTGTLSGGNQQKIVLAKWLRCKPQVLILDEPTRGVDVGARFEIYRIIRELAAEGVGILLVSSDLPEIVGLADRVVVMAKKRISAVLSHADMNAETIMRFATGASTQTIEDSIV